jgi:hypothetical protein
MHNILFKKSKGQALLVILIVGTLTLLILLGIASRINLGRTNIRRSGEFDRSISASENKIADIIGSFNEGKAQECLKNVDIYTDDEFRNLRSFNDANCNFLTSNSDIDIFSKLSQNPSVPVQYSQPSSLFLGLNSAAPIVTQSIILNCDTDISVSNGNKPDKMVVTRIYVDAQGEYKVDKGIFLCNQGGGAASAVVFYDANGCNLTTGAGNPGGCPAVPVVRSNTKMIRVRMLDGSSGNNNVSIVAQDNTGKVVGTTQKYEFMIVGAGGLGSDSIVKFEKPKDPETPLAFDFVYFGEDI